MGKLISFLFLLLGISCVCHAKVDIKTTKRLVIPVDNVTPVMTSEDVAKIVPLDLKEGDSQGTVFTRIADRGLNMWLNSPAMKSSAIMQMAEKTQEKLKTDVVVPASSPNEVSHKFSFKVEAFQALAKLEYSGWLKAAINYDAKESATNVIVKEQVFDDKEFILTHKSDKTEGLSMMGLAWSF